MARRCIGFIGICLEQPASGFLRERVEQGREFRGRREVVIVGPGSTDGSLEANQLTYRELMAQPEDHHDVKLLKSRGPVGWAMRLLRDNPMGAGLQYKQSAAAFPARTQISGLPNTHLCRQVETPFGSQPHCSVITTEPAFGKESTNSFPKGRIIDSRNRVKLHDLAISCSPCLLDSRILSFCPATISSLLLAELMEDPASSLDSFELG
ncbi:hypothetical protein N7519_008453 [Penicillium mononematosum]|uniref:uncharacterized protein n=1 Tax=Penicillium mononematosum TaxID=268346 RepID=UPI002549A0D5|nr:uncharacterized protein N7519_008453 [Penicillium mononematosum]KAJ6177992.1 hypothetical protein N7519_008453 [Penicillium mononematosum]